MSSDYLCLDLEREEYQKARGLDAVIDLAGVELTVGRQAELHKDSEGTRDI